METFSALLAICAGNSPVSGEFPAQRPVTQSFDVFFDARLIKRLSKHSRGWWFETLSHPLWRHRNDEAENVREVLRMKVEPLKTESCYQANFIDTCICHWNLSARQPPMSPVTTKLASWQLFVFSHII